MTAKKYVNAIVKKIQCGNEKKADIRRQLLAEIDTRTERGETVDEIIAQMGTVREMADGYNENIDEDEKKRFRRHRIFVVIIPTVLVVACLAYYAVFRLPKSTAIEDSEYFDRVQVENAVTETVELLDAGEYEKLKEHSIGELSAVLTEDVMDEAKSNIAQDWGKRMQFGKIYTTELVQEGVHYAVGEIVVTYENISVTYRFSYDTDMNLSGLYMK